MKTKLNVHLWKNNYTHISSTKYAFKKNTFFFKTIHVINQYFPELRIIKHVA